MAHVTGDHTVSDEDTIAVPPQTALSSRLLMIEKELYECRINDLKKYIGLLDIEDETLPAARTDLASKILNASSTNHIRQYFLRNTQLSDLLFKVLNQNRHVGQGSTLAQHISASLSEQRSLIMQLYEVEKNIGELLDETNIKIEELKKLCIEQAKIGNKIEKEKPIDSNAETQSILSRIEEIKKKLEAVSFLGQRMIFASKIDWSENTEIKELLLLFSEPVPE